MIRILLCAFCTIAGLPALAQTGLEIIRLKNRTVEQVLPAIEPLVEPGGSISGERNTLFLRASAANRADIKRALAAIDTAPRRLLVSVRQDDERIASETAGGLAMPSGGAGNPARGTIYSTRGEAGDRVDQQVQTVEGGRAAIRIGRSLPLQMRQVVYGAGGVVLAESVVYRDIGSGFIALPMLAGERVTVEISPQQESVTTSASDPTIRSSRIVTTVAGRLGEWIVLGGSGQSADAAGASGTRYSTRTGVARQRVMLRVDALD
jgi:type II secretory pathway component GspD/PulD (secretin)